MAHPITRLITLQTICMVLVAAFPVSAQQGKLTPSLTEPPPATDIFIHYRIMPGDVLDIRFFYNPELNEQEVAVRPDGRIALQLVGDVEIASKTPEEARTLIEQLFASHVRTPSVTIQIRRYASNKVFVTGEVPRPGLIALEGPMSLIGVVSEAGGITIKGNRNKVVLIRRMPGGTAAKRYVKLYERGEITQEALANMQPFDVVLVPESAIGRTDRWVDQYLRQLSPANLAVGFQYLRQAQPQSIPVF
jgi:protein involved in polysaccharide export with SLBB domain